jgi:hypothetical protein
VYDVQYKRDLTNAIKLLHQKTSGFSSTISENDNVPSLMNSELKESCLAVGVKKYRSHSNLIVVLLCIAIIIPRRDALGGSFSCKGITTIIVIVSRPFYTLLIGSAVNTD